MTRLLTFVDLDDANDDGPDAPRMCVRARHEAELDDGRRVVLLDDRGWTEETSCSGICDASVWAHQTVEELERQGRIVVGPDEPIAGETHADMEAGHWATLAGVLSRHGVDAQPGELRALPHDVVLSDRVRARIGP